uniref:Uncharacterized protein n=1 Tax=Zea mays TaxID=4577 RepID=C0PJC5_MAIZE|nr:unknown [Zea mays]|eukprot:NP_001169932.1 uncharacterized protein LOC100383829 [Zea mays]
MPLMPHSSVFACPCICCENFHLLRHSIGDTCSIRWLKCHSRLIYETFLSSRRHQSKPLSTTVLARSTRKIWRTYSHSAIIGVELSDGRQTSSLVTPNGHSFDVSFFSSLSSDCVK